jgi:hypothetical protein
VAYMIIYCSMRTNDVYNSTIILHGRIWQLVVLACSNLLLAVRTESKTESNDIRWVNIIFSNEL